MSPAERAIAALRSSGHRVATAESLTGGLLCATLVDVPGASDVVVGGVVAYTSEAKVELLGVDATVVGRRGTVDPETARLMALGALARVPGATVAVATTGVAGPDASEGHPAGTVLVAVADAHDVRVESLALPGDRAQVRKGTVAAALSMLIDRVGEETRANGR